MCLSCGKLFATAESVNIHLNIHNEDNIYACEHCDKIFAHKHIYESHRRAAHKDKEKSQEFDCSYCNNIFPNAVSLGNHMRVCKLKPREITPMTETYDLADKMILQIQAPVTKDKLVLLNNNTQKKNKNLESHGGTFRTFYHCLTFDDMSFSYFQDFFSFIPYMVLPFSKPY